MINKYIHIFIIFFVILINPKHVYAVDLSSTTPTDNAISDQNTSHAKLTLGIGATLEDGLSISFMIDHYRNDNEAFNTSLTANI